MDKYIQNSTNYGDLGSRALHDVPASVYMVVLSAANRPGISAGSSSGQVMNAKNLELQSFSFPTAPPNVSQAH